jgi:hypothetical protein
MLSVDMQGVVFLKKVMSIIMLSTLIHGDVRLSLVTQSHSIMSASKLCGYAVHHYNK